jgi:hypothetical protein
MNFVSVSSDRICLLQLVFGASALVFVVAAHNTNIETNFWTSFLTSQSRWSGTAAPTTGEMRLAQSQILLKVSGFAVRFAVLISLECALPHRNFSYS